MKPDKPEPGSDPIIGDGAARFTVVLFLALFTLGVALLIWRGLSSVPEGDHRIDQVMGALHTFSTFAAILLVLYLAIAARIYAERQEELLRLRFQQGLTEGWKQAARRFEQEVPETWQSWTEWKKLAEVASMESQPELEPPPRPGDFGS